MIERHALSEAIFADINNYLVEKGIQVSQGSMVDATIIQAASSTKNKDKKRDAEMHSTRKNNQYYFGMKIHVGTDVNSNAIHSATITPANITELPKLLRERDRVVFADAGGYRVLPELNVACSGLSVSVAREEWKQLGWVKRI